MAETTRRARVERLLAAARVLTDSATDEGQKLRESLRETTGLSAQNIELGLARCLEARPTEQELTALLASTPDAPRAHVLLSGNVFVAALRAIAIGVAASAHVSVRASRRDPVLAQALQALAPDLFELVPALQPVAGDRYWSYGSDETLGDVRRSLPLGVWFHAHGAGFGAAVVDAVHFDDADARAIALDTALFDQRGCLSPRVVCVVGSEQQTRDAAQAIAAALSSLEHELPAGPASVEEAAEARRERDAASYAFELFDAGGGWVSVAKELVVPPARRNLHVVATPDPTQALAPFARHLTCISKNSAEHDAKLSAAFPGARLVALGNMQRPPLDGPVDLRHGTLGELLG